MKSNRDAIGARIRVDGQTKWIEAGSGFLSQHSKTILFGLGEKTHVEHVSILWPSGVTQEFSNLSAGHIYSLVENSPTLTSTPFREHRPLEAGLLEPDNSMRLHDTWFLQPVPLPTPQRGPGLFVVQKATPEYEIFRRYLFDWRTSLQPPLALLLNSAGEVVKVYAAIPSQTQVTSDLASLNSRNPLPYPGFYIQQPKRDFFKFGAAYLWAGFPELALPYLSKTPENPRVLVLLGQIHLDGNRVDDAEKCFSRALELQPASVNAFIGLGDIAAKRNQPERAAGYYARALKLDTGSPEAANGLGLALAKQGKLSEARECFERAIAARRNYADAINNLAVLFTQESKTNDAIAAWTYGLQVAPDDDILYLNLGRTYVQTGQIEKARLVMQQLLDRKPDNAIARRALQELEVR
ncbi:MAG: tetratricopeptide repeat protein [Acidobacteriaceae bacterium]|nr:tetratricopeptide repeat protein [Acidobacteriaceae bacterium]